LSTIGIIGAMEEEVELLKSKMEVITVKNIVHTDFYMGKMANNNIVVVRSGIGKVNAAVCTQVLIDMYAVDYIINIGVAGAVSTSLDIGDIVISSDVVHHDFNSMDGIGVIPRMEETFFKADINLINIATEACEVVLQESKYFVERIGTGDVFISTKDLKQKIWNELNAYCAEMEGAAIGQTCYLNKIPFVIIRAISDKADESAEVSFEKFVKVSAKKSSDVVEIMVSKL
jgi:adenosylhomocysteine nucleosidase